VNNGPCISFLGSSSRPGFINKRLHLGVMAALYNSVRRLLLIFFETVLWYTPINFFDKRLTVLHIRNKSETFGPSYEIELLNEP